MRILLIAALASLSLASPAMAAGSEVNSLMAPLQSYDKDVEAMALDTSSPQSKEMEARMKRFTKCAKSFSKSPKVKKMLKTKQGKRFAAGMFGLFFTEVFSAGYNVYAPRLTQAADELDGLNLSDPKLSETAKAGASYIRDSIELFREPAGGSLGCRYLQNVAALPKWTSSRLEKAYLDAFPRTPEEMQTISPRLEQSQKNLQAGYPYLKSSGASKKQLELFSNFFSLGSDSSAQAARLFAAAR